MPIKFRVDPEKALETLLYILSKAGTDKYATLKIIYVADKLHLSRYGRFIYGDYYHALENGPAPMVAYDLMQAASGVQKAGLNELVQGALEAGRSDDPHFLIAKREPDRDFLSESDIECLDEVISDVEKIGVDQAYSVLWDRVHDAAWQKTREKNRDGLIDVERIAEQFEYSDSLIEYIAQR